MARRSAFARREAMRERGGSLAQGPARKLGPQGGQLVAAEAGAHARLRIVPANMIAAEEEDQPAAEKRQRRTARLKRDKEGRERRRPREDLRKLRRFEMMQEKIGDDDVGRFRRREIG